MLKTKSAEAWRLYVLSVRGAPISTRVSRDIDGKPSAAGLVTNTV
jgi:hypothetical protein